METDKKIWLDLTFISEDQLDFISSGPYDMEDHFG